MSLQTSLSITDKNNFKRTGDMIKPCFVLFVTLKESEISQSDSTETFISSRKEMTVIILSGMLRFLSTFQRESQLTVSKATNTIYNS